jgi:hypothetical protein
MWLLLNEPRGTVAAQLPVQAREGWDRPIGIDVKQAVDQRLQQLWLAEGTRWAQPEGWEDMLVQTQFRPGIVPRQLSLARRGWFGHR